MGNAKKTKVTNFCNTLSFNISLSSCRIINGSYDSKKSLTDIDMQIDSSTL